MANRERGEVDVVIRGKTYTLIVDFNALVELQQMYSTGTELVSVESVMVKANSGDLGALRAIFWASLRRHHPEVTVAAAGELIDIIGGIEALNALLIKSRISTVRPVEVAPLTAVPNAKTRRESTACKSRVNL